MTEIKSLADQLRNQLSRQEAPPEPTAKVKREKKKPPDVPPILESIRSYDNRDHKNLVHIRFDASTVQTLNQFKMATGIDVTKLVAFAVRHLFQEHPELKSIIKQFIQQLELWTGHISSYGLWASIFYIIYRWSFTILLRPKKLVKHLFRSLASPSMCSRNRSSIYQ